MKLRQTKRILLIQELDKICFPEDAPLEQVDLLSTIWFIAYEGKTVAAYAGIKVVQGNTGYLIRAGVLPDHRGKGLQTKLIKIRERWANKNGLKYLITYTTTDHVVSANSLIRCGFKLYRPASPWAGDYDWLYFLKTLRRS